MEKINLFCLPFAGGSKYSYRLYEEHLPSFLNIIPLEYPGRGTRMNETLKEDIKQLVNDLYLQVAPKLDAAPYAIYGHSMGGLLCYLLARKISEEGRMPPLHLFITGTSGPSALSRVERKRHLLDKKSFIEEVRNLNGSPDEILQNDELLDFIEPILRADFKVSENYAHINQEPLDIPVTVITGTKEDIKPEDIRLWQRETNRPVDFRRMPGHHFFIFKYPYEIVGIIAKKLLVHHKSYQL
ncbi:thioesterase II family protein [Chitinophaga qingshengii]|uniref:Thioesterase n=1 Tax=Chitinophaga qingshengii TaxID=1569794 RepID=A0ABR7TS43_9BACT|nr:thioesterase [Chitinophaga qingshengii]MBC9932835.1 thioesterase [Chitinophaga qingshengii]